MTRFQCSFPVAVVLLALVSQSASAQPAKRTAEVLPTEAQSWLNSPPITAEMLKGKAAVLWFFEET